MRALGAQAATGRILLCAMLGGAVSCAPHYRLETAPGVLASEWTTPTQESATALPADQEIWPAFKSAELEQLITRARASNADIAIARERIVQARGQLGVARASAFPTLTANASSSFLRQSNGQGKTSSSDNASGGLNLNYEVDLFGVNAAVRHGAGARLSAAAFDREAIRLIVESEVARAYVQYAALWDRLAVLDRALANAKELERVIGIRVREGVASQVDLGFQTVEVQGLEADRTSALESIAITRNALAVLVGEEAPLFSLGRTTLATLEVPTVEAIQPAGLLQRRPDILAAEARMAAAQYDVTRARRAFLPTLAFSAGSVWTNALGGPVQLAKSALGSLFAPLFDGGRLRGDLLSTTGAQHISVETYRKTILTALQEGEDALSAVELAKQREMLLSKAIVASNRTAKLARMQYVEGVADLQTMLNAQRGALSIEQSLMVARQDRLNAAISLYKALGGVPSRRKEGWLASLPVEAELHSPAPEATPPPPRRRANAKAPAPF